MCASNVNVHPNPAVSVLTLNTDCLFGYELNGANCVPFCEAGGVPW